MPKKDPAKLTKISTSLPFGIGTFEWEADDKERRAAWSLYVELVSRTGVQPLDLEHGLIREALTSLHNLFQITRDILKEAGPDVGSKPASVGSIALSVLNQGIRPFLNKWHSQLLAWEEKRPVKKSLLEHEAEWSAKDEIRKELAEMHLALEQYADALAIIAGLKLPKVALSQVNQLEV